MRLENRMRDYEILRLEIRTLGDYSLSLDESFDLNQSPS
jgi:hypothetical protein